MNEEITRLQIELAKSKDYLNIKDVVLLSNLSLSTIHRRIKDVSGISLLLTIKIGIILN